jgi:hypothetical protein
MPEKTPSRHINVRLTELEWSLLESVAQQRGKKNFRRLLNCELHRLCREHPHPAPVATASPRRHNHYQIPEELLAYYEHLARVHDVSVTTIIMRLVIFPLLYTTGA